MAKKKLYDEEGNVVKGAKVKKPIYKRWWFIALVAVFVIGIIASGGDDEGTATGNTSTETETVENAGSEQKPEEPEEAIVVTADEILSAYVDNEVNANKVYKGKLVEVTGTLKSISESDSGKVTLVIGADSDDLWLEDMSVDLSDSTGIESASTDSKITVQGIADTGILYTIKLSDGKIVE